ncbi:MAG: integron integrase, partial [Gammaproteobacteria bacterium]
WICSLTCKHYMLYYMPTQLGAKSHLSAIFQELRNSGLRKIRQALSAILFLYKEVLGRELEWLDNVERAKRPARVPMVLTKTGRLLGELEGCHWLVASLL